MSKRMKISRKTFAYYFDNQWSTKLATHYVDLLSVNLGREQQSMITKINQVKNNTVLTIHTGKNYRLKMYVIGLGVCFYWHRHNRTPSEDKLIGAENGGLEKPHGKV